MADLAVLTAYPKALLQIRDGLDFSQGGIIWERFTAYNGNRDDSLRLLREFGRGHVRYLTVFPS